LAALKSAIWAAALVRRAQVGTAAAFVTRRGDPDAGVVIVKIARLDGTADVYLPARDMEGERAWRPAAVAPMPEAEADAIVRRETGYDPDCWVVEIEDKAGRHFLTEPVLAA
jgi:hypothetical protein